ncbi:MAG: hypothetical protein HYT29_01360 [Parcubacteria group bacterium]|nr:hypothetical protein [Parcubacteria group bacterium]
MAEKIRAALIDTFINQLVSSFGGIVPPIAPDELHDLHKARDFTKMMGYIRDLMRLKGLPLRIGYVKKGGHRQSVGWLVDSAPLYGTPAFQKKQITIYLRKIFLRDAPFESVVVCMAHELSHIVLDSLRHPLKDTEEAVDVAAMILGYRNFYRKGSSYSKISAYRGASFFRKMILYLKWFFGRIAVDEDANRVLGYLTPEEVAYVADALDRFAATSH